MVAVEVPRGYEDLRVDVASTELNMKTKLDRQTVQYELWKDPDDDGVGQAT